MLSIGHIMEIHVSSPNSKNIHISNPFLKPKPPKKHPLINIRQSGHIILTKTPQILKPKRRQ